MKLPTRHIQVARVGQILVNTEGVGVTPSQVSIPAAIAVKLASDYSIDAVTGLAQCVGTLAGILSNYQRCVDSGSNVNCANIAARHIATVACRSYCSCS